MTCRPSRNEPVRRNKARCHRDRGPPQRRPGRLVVVTPDRPPRSARGSRDGQRSPDPLTIGSTPRGVIVLGTTRSVVATLVQRQLCGDRPELKPIAATAVPMSIVAAQHYVQRDRAAIARPRSVQQTGSIPLYPRSFRGLEVERVQHLLHRDLPANCLEVGNRHGCSSLAVSVVGCSRTVPFPFISMRGTGTISRDSIRRLVSITPVKRPPCQNSRP
jgi:hypothetical protein